MWLKAQFWSYSGDSKDPGSARWADEEDGNDEHPDGDQQDAERGEGQDGARTAANPSKGIICFIGKSGNGIHFKIHSIILVSQAVTFLRIQTSSAHLRCVSGTKAGVRHHANAAGQLWAEWEERHAAGGEEVTGGGDKALESSDPGQEKDYKGKNNN